MRGLKQVLEDDEETQVESHLLQMRGLKQDTCQISPFDYGSHLLQMRGLKPKYRSGT